MPIGSEKTNMKKRTKKGYVILLIGIVLSILPYLITDYSFQKYPDENIFDVAFWSFLCGTALVAPYFFITKSKRKTLKNEIKNSFPLLLKVVLLTGVGVLFWFYSMKFGKSGIVSFLKKSDIIFTLILGTIFLKEKISIQEIFGASVAIIGFSVMSKNSLSEISIGGICAIIFTQIFYVLQSFFVRRDGQKINTQAFTFLRMVGITVLTGVFGLISGQLSMIPLEAILLFGVGQVAGAFLFLVVYFEAHKYLEISKISIFLLISPVLTLIASWAFLNEEIHALKIIGSSIILVGLLLFTLKVNIKKVLKKFDLKLNHPIANYQHQTVKITANYKHK